MITPEIDSWSEDLPYSWRTQKNGVSWKEKPALEGQDSRFGAEMTEVASMRN